MTQAPFASKILATGSAFPKRRVTNSELTAKIETTDEWIFERTGIRARRVADIAGGESNTGFALEAAKSALSRAALTPTDLDLILFCTVSPDTLIPTAACILQQKLGARNIAAMDLSAACSGFVYGLSVADAYLKSGMYKNVLVVGAEVLSQLVDWHDRGTCILFGDGAGAAIVSRTTATDKSRILSTHLHADGSLQDLFFMEAGGSSLRITPDVIDKKQHFMKMKGKEIFKEAVRTLADCAIEALNHNNLTIHDVDWFIPHQANLRIVDAVAKRLEFPMEKVILNIEEFGNTSAATVPTALDAAITEGKIKRGDLLLLDVFGAGLTYGSALVRY